MVVLKKNHFALNDDLFWDLQAYSADVSREKLLQEGEQGGAGDLYRLTKSHLSQCCSSLSRNLPWDREKLALFESCCRCYSQLGKINFFTKVDNVDIVRDLKTIVYIVSKLPEAQGGLVRFFFYV